MDTNKTLETCNADYFIERFENSLDEDLCNATHGGTKQLCHLRHECLRFKMNANNTFYQQKDSCQYFVGKSGK